MTVASSPTARGACTDAHKLIKTWCMRLFCALNYNVRVVSSNIIQVTPLIVGCSGSGTDLTQASTASRVWERAPPLFCTPNTY